MVFGQWAVGNGVVVEKPTFFLNQSAPCQPCERVHGDHTGHARTEQCQTTHVQGGGTKGEGEGDHARPDHGEEDVQGLSGYDAGAEHGG